jgi:predicted dehydrogenase
VRPDPPRVLVVGAGSAGSRHARLLAARGATVQVMDVDHQRAEAVGDGVAAVAHDPTFAGDHELIVLATPTSGHADDLRRALATKARVLIEKPLAATGQQLDGVEDAATGRVMVGYNLRLHPPVERVIELVRAGRAGRTCSVRAWFGSWLPDWRPGTDYRAGYSARADAGGGVLLDAIHELDILVWLLGTDLAVAGAVVGRVSPLEIDTEDVVAAVVRTPSGVPATIELDYISRRYRRGIEIIGDHASIRLDWARQVIEIEDRDGVVSEDASTPVMTSYERQADRALAWIAGRADPPVDAAEGAVSVRLADAIRAAAS